jgi:hypothetical protein
VNYQYFFSQGPPFIESSRLVSSPGHGDVQAGGTRRALRFAGGGDRFCGWKESGRSLGNTIEVFQDLAGEVFFRDVYRKVV